MEGDAVWERRPQPVVSTMLTHCQQPWCSVMMYRCVQPQRGG